MKTYTLDEVQDTLIGKIGTPERDLFEYELQLDLIGSHQTNTPGTELDTRRVGETYRCSKISNFTA